MIDHMAVMALRRHLGRLEKCASKNFMKFNRKVPNPPSWEE